MERVDEMGLLRIIRGEQGGDTPWNSTLTANQVPLIKEMAGAVTRS